jgi:hypothetical protein
LQRQEKHPLFHAVFTKTKGPPAKSTLDPTKREA